MYSTSMSTSSDTMPKTESTATNATTTTIATATGAGTGTAVAIPTSSSAVVATNNNNLQQQMVELQNVLRGNFQQNINVPSPKLRQIRIFLCSTFTDLTEEREIFWFEILPELQNHCLQYGSDILLYDPFQGKENDPVYQPHLTQQLLRQIQECRSQSEGVFFVCLLGDKYGPCPLPTSLRSEEYQNIRTTAFEAGKDIKTLEEWYKLDQNANPPTYELIQTVANKNFDLSVFNQLQETLQHGAHLAHQDGLINQVNPKLQERFFTSYVEQAIQSAIEGWKQHQSNCIFVLRKLEGIQNNASNSAYFDNVPVSFPNWSPQENITRLKNSLSDSIDKTNLESFKITCSGDAVAWQRSANWEKYLVKFTEHLTNKLKNLIDVTFAISKGHWTKCQTNTERLLSNNQTLKNIYEESWYHYQEVIAKKPSKLIGHVDLLRKIRDLCRDAQKKAICPIILQGDDGCGKTALICEIASIVNNWLGADVTVVVRFVNLIGTSKFVHEMIRSICLQICLAHSLDSLMTTYKDVYSADRIVEWFESCCVECTKKSGQCLVILIDDIHLLKYGHNFGGRGTLQRLSWIPSTLPQNVVILLTSSGHTTNEMLPLKKVDSKFLVKIPPSVAHGELVEIAKNVLNKYQKSVSADQLGAIRQALKSCPSPLYAGLLGYDARHWSTYHTFNGKGLPTTLNAYLEQKLNRLEKLCGTEFCSNVCSYLECAMNGLTETEIFDLVSSNRDIMQKFNSDQTSGRLCRLPCTFWITFKNELGTMLSQRVLDAKTVYSWSHSFISATVRNRYLNSSPQLKKCHSDMADLFNDTWSFNENSNERSTTGKLNHKFIMPQPLHTTEPSSSEIHYNRRRVTNLWYHLLHSGSVDYFEEQSLCNFDYLDTLLNASGLTRLLSVMEDASLQILNHDLHMLQGIVIKPALNALSCCNSLLAGEVIGRLRYTRAKNTVALNNLVDQAMAWVDNCSHSPLLVPLTCWVKPPLCPLVVSFQLQDWSGGTTTLMRPTLTYQHLFVAGTSNGVISMYHISSNKLVKTFAGHTGKVLCLELGNNGQFFVTSGADRTVRSWDIPQGTCIRNMNPHAENVLCLLLTHDDRHLITGSSDSTAKVTDLETNKVIRTFGGRSGMVRALALSSHSEYLVTGQSDFTVIVWNMDSGEMLTQLGGLMAPVSNLALTSNDTFLLVTCDDETLKVFSLCRGNELHELRGHEGKVLTLAIANDDCQVFCGNSDGNIYCYDLHTGQLLSVQNCHNAPVSSLKVSEDGHFLFSGSAENVHVWNIERPADYRRQEDGKNLAVVAMSRDYKYAAAGNFSGLIYLWDLELCHCLWITQEEPPSRVTHLQFDIEASLLFSGSLDGSVNVWSMANGSLLRKYKGHNVAIRTIQIFADRSRILSHDISGAVKIWRLLHNEDEEEDETEVQFKGTSDLLRLINDCEILAKVGDVDKELRVWNFVQEEGIVARAKMTHNEAITCMCMSRDCKFVVTGSKDQSLKIWESSTGYLTQILVGHNDGVICCALNETFQVVISAASDNSVYAWDIDTGTIMSSFTESVKGSVTALDIAADGNLGLAGYKDGWLHAWSTETGAKIASFNAHMPICEILTTPEAHRMLLRLEQCPNMSVVCLHNCPPLGDTLAAKKRKNSRRNSKTSADWGANSSTGGTASVATADSQSVTAATTRPNAPQRPAQLKEKSKEKASSEKRSERRASKVFAPIERSRSRATLYDSPTQTNKFPERSSSEKLKSSLPLNTNNSSKVCRIL